MLWFQSLKLRRNSLLLSQLPWLSLPPVFSRSLEGIKIHAGRLSMFANIWKPWRAKHNVTSVDNIYHATPVSMLIMNDTELNQTSLSLNACDLCVLCLSTFSRSNSRLQLLPHLLFKSFQLSHCFQHSTEPCILSPKHLRQSMATTCYKTYRIFAASGRDVNCCSLHWCHITSVQFCHLRKGWHHLSCKMLYIGNMPCQNCVTLVDPCCEHFQLRGEV